MPPALSLGIALSTLYYRYYQVGQTSNPNMSSPSNGAVTDPQFDHTPVQQTYGGQVYLRYTLPAFGDLRSDVTVSYGQGDPTLGYTSVLHDGVAHGYFFWRTTSEIFAALTLRY